MTKNYDCCNGYEDCKDCRARKDAKGSRGDKTKTSRTVRHWYCCGCGHGPYDTKYYDECVNSTCRTSHRRCENCPVERVKIYTRY